MRFLASNTRILEHTDGLSRKRIIGRLAKEQKEKPFMHPRATWIGKPLQPFILVDTKISARSKLNRQPQRTRKMLNPRKREPNVKEVRDRRRQSLRAKTVRAEKAKKAKD